MSVRHLRSRTPLSITGGGGGGGAAPVTVRSAHITAGNVTPLPASATWVPARADFEITVPAAVGDWAEFSTAFMWDPASSTSQFLDLAIVVGSTAVRYLSSGTATPAIEGAPWFYTAPSVYRTVAGIPGFTVTPGDLDGGNLRCQLVTRGAGTGTLFSSSTFPFWWAAYSMPQTP